MSKYTKDANGDWDWRNDRQRNPRLQREDAAKPITTARNVAAIVLARGKYKRRMSLPKLNAVLYRMQMEHVRDSGRPLFGEAIRAVRDGVRVDTITPDWYRREVLRQRRLRVHLPSLRSRVRTWGIREAHRRDAQVRFGRTNMPGGWSRSDAVAQRGGLARAALSVRARKPWWATMACAILSEEAS